LEQEAALVKAKKAAVQRKAKSHQKWTRASQMEKR